MVSRHSRALSELDRGDQERVEKKLVMSDPGDCVVGTTSVWLADGRHIPIQELVGSTRAVFAMAPTAKS